MSVTSGECQHGMWTEEHGERGHTCDACGKDNLSVPDECVECMLAEERRERSWDRLIKSEAVSRLRAIRSALFVPRGALTDCKVCGDCWETGQPEQHGRQRLYSGELIVTPCPMDGVTALLERAGGGK